jgi:pimeloyl-ACP methyl ester carboxylesterase/class 3 adenylate cyclase
MESNQVPNVPVDDVGPDPSNGPVTRYATTPDGLSIAYQVLGQGPPNLVWVPGFAAHVELFWGLTGFAHTFRRLAGFSRLALFDKRGTGLSDRSLGTGTLEDRMSDVAAVMDAAAMESAVLVGVSEGGAMAALFAAAYPNRVERLVLIGAAMTGEWIQPSLIAEVEQAWGTGALLQRLWLNGGGDVSQLGRIERGMGSPRAMAAMMRHNLEGDARAALGSVQAPTLVLHCTGDPVVPIASGRHTAAAIPGARFVAIPGDFHGSNRPKDMDRYVDEIAEFVTGHRDRARGTAERILATLLMTDIVGSTDRAAQLGDERWTGLLEEHDRVARGAVESFGGRWVSSTGDGLLALFDGPSRAVGAARSLARGLAPYGLRIRAGIHVGEVVQRGGGVEGIAVHLTARIAAVAAAGEAWVSPTVPGLAVGSGIEFEDRGGFELKGVPGSWHLAAVHLEQSATP